VSSTVHEYHLQTRLTERELRKGIKAARDVLGTTTSTWFTIVALVVLTAMMAMIWATSLGHEWGWLVITGAIAGGAGYLWLSTRLRFLVRRVLRREPGALEGIDDRRPQRGVDREPGLVSEHVERSTSVPRLGEALEGLLQPRR